MNNNTVINLMRSAECKSAEEIKNYAQACVELDIVKYVDNQMVINMRSVIEITDQIIQGNNPEILSYIREYYTETTTHSMMIGGLVDKFKFSLVWRKVQSTWGKMAPYVKVFGNGMYIPFNEDVLDCFQELLEEYFGDALELDASFNTTVERFRSLPHAEVLRAIKDELSSAMK